MTQAILFAVVIIFITIVTVVIILCIIINIDKNTLDINY